MRLKTYRFRRCRPHLRLFLGRVLRLVHRADQAATDAGEAGDGAAWRAATWCGLFEASLRLLHPVMPFITEEIWHAMYDGKPPLKSIALAAYPEADE